MNKKFIIVWLFAVLAAVNFAGCSGSSSAIVFDGISPVPADIDIAGRWRPIDRENRAIYYNEFKAAKSGGKGNFAAYTANGRNTLAIGFYVPTPTGALVQYFSEVQKREIRTVCVFETRNRIACTENNNEPIRLERN